MSNLDDFLTNLTDHELAIFFANSYDGFLDHSKRKIDAEIEKRQLSKIQIKALKDTKLQLTRSDQTNTCYRCGSDKLFVETDYKEIPISELSSAEIAIDSYRCRLCGYNPNKTKQKDFHKKIKMIIRRWRNQRIHKWNDI